MARLPHRARSHPCHAVQRVFPHCRRRPRAFPSLTKGASTNPELPLRPAPAAPGPRTQCNIPWSDYWHNQSSQAALLTAFEGITESRVNTAENHQLNTSWAAESSPRNDQFHELPPHRRPLAEPPHRQHRFPPCPHLPANYFRRAAGRRHAIRRSIFQRPWWGVQISGIVNTQLQNPLFLARVAYRPLGACPNGDCRATLSYDASLGRTTRALAKLGLRRETRDSWADGASSPAPSAAPPAIKSRTSPPASFNSKTSPVAWPTPRGSSRTSPPAKH